MAAYNYLVAKDASSISAEISSDAFDRNPILNNANEAQLIHFIIWKYASVFYCWL